MALHVIVKTLKGGLKWTDYGRAEALILDKGKRSLAGWHPKSGYFNAGIPGIRRGHLGFVVQNAGRSRLVPTIFFYKTWQGWKNAVWREYRVRPPACYVL